MWQCVSFSISGNGSFWKVYCCSHFTAVTLFPNPINVSWLQQAQGFWEIYGVSNRFFSLKSQKQLLDSSALKFSAAAEQILKLNLICVLTVKDLPLPRFVVGKNEAEARHAALYQDPDSQGLYPAPGTAVIPRPPGRGHQNKKGHPSSTSLPVHEVIQPLATTIESQVGSSKCKNRCCRDDCIQT